MNTESPIQPLLTPFLSTPYTVAPERASELHEIITTYGLKVYFVSSQEFTLEVSWLLKQIRVSVPTLERIWAYSYAHLYITWLFQQEPQGVELDLTLDSKRNGARRLLEWAFRADVEGKYSEWPEDLPKPDTDETSDDNIKPANEVFLVTLGWILLHEIGHIVLGHEKNICPLPEEAVAMELAADDWASSWMLIKWRNHKDDIRVFQKRSLGITFGIGLQAGLELHHEAGDIITHPNIADRLLAFLDKYVPEQNATKATPEELAWLAGIAILQTSICNTRRSFVMQPIHDGFRDFIMDLKNQL